jgi:dimethylsulfone monooxygenase
MFGGTLSQDLYPRATEWLEILERAYGSAEPFDFEGQHYKLRGVVSRPASVQAPRPIVMNAAFGAPGRDFAARNCDFLFSTFADIEDGRRHVADIRERARTAGRQVGVYTVCHVVCRETQAEAEDYYRHYAVEHADHGAVDYHMARKKEFANSHDERAFAEYRQRFAGGAGTFPLVGTPERIAEKLVGISAEGYEGAALSFVNYAYELPFFCDRVLPLLRQAGLRVERTL